MAQYSARVIPDPSAVLVRAHRTAPATAAWYPSSSKVRYLASNPAHDSGSAAALT